MKVRMDELENNETHGNIYYFVVGFDILCNI